MKPPAIIYPDVYSPNFVAKPELLPERTGRGGRPPHIPKFEETHAETGFDRECASSNPLTPANQSGF
jgi:hypothetical protein